MKRAELFEVILERPALYVGNDNISNIYYFMNGYHMALLDKDGRDKDGRDKDGRDKDDEDLYFNFSYWLDEIFQVNLMTQSWMTIISSRSNGQDKAYETTKELWYKYRDAIEKGWKPREIA